MEAIKAEFQLRLTREGEIETAVSQSLIILGLFGLGKKTTPVAPWTDELRPLLDEIMARLEELQVDNAESRLLAVQLPRFDHEYKGRGLALTIERLDAALAAQTPDLAESRLASRLRDNDKAALLYNRACYANLLSREMAVANKDREAEKWKREAQNNIDEALTLNPRDRAQAQSDDQLDGLKR